MDFKKGSACGDDKALKAARKKSLQRKLKDKLSLTVDVVKQGKLYYWYQVLLHGFPIIDAAMAAIGNLSDLKLVISDPKNP